MRTVLLAGVLCLLVAPAQARVIYVDIDATGANDGSSWLNAYVDLQEALGAASAGDEIWVAEGTHTPTNGADRSATFTIPLGVALYGGFAGAEARLDERDWDAHVTVLSGEIGVPDPGSWNSDNSYHIVTVIEGNTETCLDGFTVSGGNTHWDPQARNGAGLRILGGEPRFSNMIVERNYASDGGGVDISGSARPEFRDVLFSGNLAGPHGHGGAVYSNYDSTPVFRNCDFLNNRTFMAAGAFSGRGEFYDVTFVGNATDEVGGAVNGSGTFERVLFEDNRSEGAAYGSTGAIGAGNSRFVDVVFRNNSAGNGKPGGALYSGGGNSLTNVIFEGNGAGLGGGMFSYSGGDSLVNVLFVGNRAYWQSGGALYVGEVPFSPYQHAMMPMVLTNVTFAGNWSNYQEEWPAGLGVSAVDVRDTEVLFTNCIFWGNEVHPGGPNYVAGREATLTFANCLLESSGGSGPAWNVDFGGDLGGNIDADPLFADSDGGDLRLTLASPAINAGNTSALPAGVICDLDGNARIYGPSVDMGAYEFQGPSWRDMYAAKFTPQTLNPEINGQYVQAHIQAQRSFEISDIDAASVVLNDSIAPVSAKASHQVLKLKFERQEVAAGLEPGRKVAVTVSGLLIDGTPFAAADTITVLGEPDDDSDAPSLAPEGPLVSELVVAPRAYLRAAPNPFNPSTTISFGVTQAAHVELVIYDLAGRRVKTLVSEQLAAGDDEATWNGRDDAGNQVARGVYLYQLRAGAHVETRRMVLVK